MTLDLSKNARILEKREARYRRANKARRIVFYCMMLGATLTLRMNPQLVTDIAGYFTKSQNSQQFATISSLPSQRASMPKDRVKVHRGIGRPLSTAPQNSEELAQQVEQALKDFEVGQ